MSHVLTDIYRYPLKSGRAQVLAGADVEPWGLAGDRRWMVIDADGVPITARERPRLILTEVDLDGDKLRLRHPGADDLVVAVPNDSALLAVEVWGARLQAAWAGAEADAWFTELAGEPARLVYLDDPTRRPVNPLRANPDDRVSLADGYPLLLTSSASLSQLNELIATGPRSDEGPVPMLRFRPNVVVDGHAPWEEDRWRRIRIGAVNFRSVKACDRCVMTTVDPATGHKGKEPITTLAKHRRWDGKTWFGVNLIPDGTGRIEVGDAVEVLDQVGSAEPQR